MRCSCGRAVYRSGVCVGCWRAATGETLDAPPMAGWVAFAELVVLDTDECVLFALPGVYGALRDGSQWIVAHRLACVFAHGEPPDDKPMALHRCQEPACINGRHLEWGDNAENQRQRYIHAGIEPGPASVQALENR